VVLGISLACFENDDWAARSQRRTGFR